MHVELVATRGLPGAGKTTWARGWVDELPEQRARVNRDDLRLMMHHGLYLPPVDFAPGTERLITAARDAAVTALLLAKVSVVCDDPNLRPSDLEALRTVATLAGSVPLKIVDLSDVDLDTCIRRDAARSRTVGETVIRQMYAQHVDGRGYPLPSDLNPANPEYDTDHGRYYAG